MPSRTAQASNDLWSLPLPIRSGSPDSDESLEYEIVTSSQEQNELSNTPEMYKDSDEMSECWSDASMEDEEEIIVCLNSRAMAMLPRRLQIIMRQMYSQRYTRLKLENPDVRVMPEDYWITPPESLGPTPTKRAPTPLLAKPQRIVSSTAYEEGFRAGYESSQGVYAQAEAYIQTFGPSNNPRQWDTQVRPSRNAFATSHPVNFSRRQLRQNGQRISQPENSFHVFHGYHKPLPPNLEFTQQYHNGNIRGGSTLKSLSISNLRKGIKRSLSRLNKWMKS